MFRKFFRLFSPENNWEQLRKFTDSRKTPCIPHIGIFLTDLMFVQDAMKRNHTPFGERSNHQINRDSMISTLASFQDSTYGQCCLSLSLISITLYFPDELEVVPHLQRYLESICFDRNNIKAEEERLYQRSLELEQGEDLTPKKSSFSYLTNLSFKLKTPTSQRNFLTAEAKTKSLTPTVTPSMKPKFTRGHRKAQSLGNPSAFG